MIVKGRQTANIVHQIVLLVGKRRFATRKKHSRQYIALDKKYPGLLEPFNSQSLAARGVDHLLGIHRPSLSLILARFGAHVVHHVSTRTPALNTAEKGHRIKTHLRRRGAER